MPHSDFDFLPLYSHRAVSLIARNSLPRLRSQLDDALREDAQFHGVTHEEKTTEIAHRWLLRRCHAYTKANTPPMAVYVPADPEALFIAKGSAIVAKSEPDATGRVTVYFEGNLYGAENLRRFEERLLSASGRAATFYPTSAIASFNARQLKRVGTYDYATGRLDVTDQAALDDWLAVETSPTSA
jgi:uncharacterized protein YdhG (YjbR/CyaY superfamily)